MATNLTDELLVFVWYNMVVSASLVRSWECCVLFCQTVVLLILFVWV